MQKCSGASRGFLKFLETFQVYMSIQQRTVYCSLIPSLHAAFPSTYTTHMQSMCTFLLYKCNLMWTHLGRRGCGHRRLVWMLHENTEVYSMSQGATYKTIIHSFTLLKTSLQSFFFFFIGENIPAWMKLCYVQKG